MADAMAWPDSSSTIRRRLAIWVVTVPVRLLIAFLLVVTLPVRLLIAPPLPHQPHEAAKRSRRTLVQGVNLLVELCHLIATLVIFEALRVLSPWSLT